MFTKLEPYLKKLSLETDRSFLPSITNVKYKEERSCFLARNMLRDLCGLQI